MMNRITQSLSLLLSFRGKKPYFPGEKQVFLFTKRPILYRDFTPKNVRDAINELQLILQEKGFLKNVTGEFDLGTEEAVKEFQRKNHLYVDGIVGALTWACLFYPNLYNGVRDLSPGQQDTIKELQVILYKEEFLKKEPNGIFDRQTEKAVKQFQRVYGLKDDGVVGAATWAVLLGMRQRIHKHNAKSLFLLPLEILFLWNQLLIIASILLGIYHSPLPGNALQLNTATAFATAYGLTCVVPFLIDFLPPLKYYDRNALPLFRYAPYVLTGIFWKPIINFFGNLFN
jgi:Putative peptidoglycan binding domain